MLQEHSLAFQERSAVLLDHSVALLERSVAFQERSGRLHERSMALDQGSARAQRWSETVKERSTAEEESLVRQGEHSVVVLRGSGRENERSGASCELNPPCRGKGIKPGTSAPGKQFPIFQEAPEGRRQTAHGVAALRPYGTSEKRGTLNLAFAPTGRVQARTN